MTKPTTTYLVTAIVFFALGALVGGWIFTANEARFRIAEVAEQAEHVLEPLDYRVVLDFGDGRMFATRDQTAAGATAYSAMQASAEQFSLSVEADDSYDFGVFVRAIGDRKNGDDGKFWQYWVNGEFAQVAADKYELQEGDTVEWKFIEQQPIQ